MNPSDELRTLGLLAGTMGSSAKIYHAGYVVPDIREAIATMRQALGVTFTEPMALPIEEIGSVHGRHRIQLEFAYSAAPMHFELVSSVPGTMWDFNSAERGHHIGVWSDDLHADAARLDALGMPRIWWGLDAQGEMAHFCFHQTPYGFTIELVDTVARAFYPDWFRAVEPGLIPPPL